MKKLIVAVALFAGACASHEDTKPVAVRDQVAVRMESIATEQRAGFRAKEGCTALGLQGNKHCEGDLARAGLNIGPTTELPRFTGIEE